MKNTNRFLVSFLFFIFLLSPIYYAKAANIGFSPSSASYQAGDTINVKVYVGTDSKSINAISATVKFPSDILSLTSISKVGSIINLWAQEPSFSNGDGIASFEGVVLNGYTGNAGNAVTLIFKAKKNGTANLSFNSASVLANDGNGTEVLYSKGSGSLTIAAAKTPEVAPIKKEATVTTPVKKETAPAKVVVKDTTIVVSEIKNNTSKYSPNKFLITSPQPVADKSYSIQIDSMSQIIWTDDGTHIFQAPVLENGIHTIKVRAVDMNSDNLSGSMSFSTTILRVPTITYYPTDLYVDQFLVLKGTADPAVDVELTLTNIGTGAVIIDNVPTNGDGKFTYVPENKMPSGVYSVMARTTTQNGINSDYTIPIQIANKENKINFFISMFSNYMTILIPFIALIALVIILLIYSIYRIKRFNLYVNKKLSGAENIISKSFDILNEDADEEIEIFKKIRSNKVLNKEEQLFLGKFKKDIKEAEKVIEKEVEKIDSN